MKEGFSSGKRKYAEYFDMVENIFSLTPPKRNKAGDERRFSKRRPSDFAHGRPNAT
ncbi:6793_t:CDS:2, partial [Gigaspora rosea]